MKTIKKYFWVALVLCAIVSFTVWRINQERYREWEQLQVEIKISAEEALQAFEGAGIRLESSEDETKDVSKARFGEPISAFSSTVMLEKSHHVDILEYQDWKTALSILEYQTDYLRSNSLDYKGAIFSHGALVIYIYPSNMKLKVQLQQILMDRYNLTKQGTQSR